MHRTFSSLLRHRPLRLYALGHLLMLLGAWLMSVTGSMLPMALGASAALMLTMPVVRTLWARAARPSDKGRRPD